MSSKDKNILKF